MIKAEELVVINHILEKFQTRGVWLQRLNPNTDSRDCSPLFQEEEKVFGRPTWRAKLGHYGEWGFGQSIAEALEAAQQANVEAGLVREVVNG